MADRCYNRCYGCELYEPVSYGYGDTVRKVKKVLELANPGCYYASKLPWTNAHWCWFYGSKENAEKSEVETLRSLTWDDVMSTVKQKSR